MNFSKRTNQTRDERWFVIYMQRARKVVCKQTELSVGVRPVSDYFQRRRLGDGITFTFSLIAICPLAGVWDSSRMVGGIYKLNVGGLLNASFGNATK